MLDPRSTYWPTNQQKIRVGLHSFSSQRGRGGANCKSLDALVSTLRPTAPVIVAEVAHRLDQKCRTTKGSPRLPAAKRSGDVIVHRSRPSPSPGWSYSTIFGMDRGTNRALRPESILGVVSCIVPEACPN